ncbi:MAG: hypothetical protein AAB558_00855 [Patescibacteria group bacterium]
MPDIPYWVLGLIYLVGVGIFLFWSSFYIYLMLRYGLFDGRGKFYTLFFLTFTVINIGLVSLALIETDWFQAISLFPERPNFSL